MAATIFVTLASSAIAEITQQNCGPTGSTKVRTVISQNGTVERNDSLAQVE
jgi:hypothetical protein